MRYSAFALLMAVGTVYAATHIRPLTDRLQPSAAPLPSEAPQSAPRRVPSAKTAAAAQKEAPKVETSPEAESPPANAPAPIAAREPAGRSPAPSSSAEHWRRAAQGLRDGDYRSADAALKELTRSGTEADRESALLVQAQVLLAQGREREAQRLLKSLEGSARAPSVRRKSAELLARLRERPAQRAGAARGVNDSP